MPIVTCVLVLACLALFAGADPALLEWNREAIQKGEIWRLWTGHFTHYSFRHVLLDGGFALLAGALAERELGARFLLVLLALASTAIGVGLVLATSLDTYRGLSGLGMALAGAAAAAWWSRSPGSRRLILVLVAALAGKLALEAGGWSPNQAGLPPGVGIAWQAHLAGVALGAIASLLAIRSRVRSS